MKVLLDYFVRPILDWRALLTNQYGPRSMEQDDGVEKTVKASGTTKIT